MLDKENIDLSNYRMQKARNCLIESNNDINEESYESSVTRSYYAMFHAIRAILALDSLDFKHHSAVISRFRELYIKTGLLSAEMSNYVGSAFNLRGNADYADFFVISKDEAQKQLEQASKFLEETTRYIQTKLQ